jgi:hypothetical protein
VVVIGIGIAFSRAAGNRSLSTFDVRTAVLAACVIAAVRLGLCWTALALFSRPDWRQGIGYALMMVSAILELGMASSVV